MKTNLEIILANLKDANMCFIMPNIVLDGEMKMKEWQKQDDLNQLLDKHFTPNEVLETFSITPISFGKNHVNLLYGVKPNGEIEAIIETLTEAGLVDIRANPSGEFALEVEDIDIENLPINGFGLFSFAEYRDFDLSVFEKEEI